jgi:hypothetical protein
MLLASRVAGSIWVCREVEVEEKRFASEVRGVVLAMVERAGSGQPIAVERDALSLESIRDGHTLTKFGVPATREKPDVGGEGRADRSDRADGGAAAAAAAAAASGEGSTGAEADRVLVPSKDLCEDLAALLSDKEMADSALSDAEAARMEQLLAVSDACKAWQKADKQR